MSSLVKLGRALVSRAHKAVWIDPDQILWCEPAGSGTKIHFTDGQDLTVDQSIGQHACLFGDRWKLIRPIEALAGFEPGFAVLYAELHAIAVEFDLVAPSLTARRASSWWTCSMNSTTSS